MTSNNQPSSAPDSTVASFITSTDQRNSLLRVNWSYSPTVAYRQITLERSSLDEKLVRAGRCDWSHILIRLISCLWHLDHRWRFDALVDFDNIMPLWPFWHLDYCSLLFIWGPRGGGHKMAVTPVKRML